MDASWLVQCGQRVAAASIGRRQKGQFLLDISAAGLMKILGIRQATNPMITKLICSGEEVPNAELH
jgi:hypothetical protein